MIEYGDKRLVKRMTNKVKIEGKSDERYEDIKKAIILDKARQFTIIRGDSVQELTIYNEDAIHKLPNYHNKTFYPISSGFPLTIDSNLVDLSINKDEIIVNNSTKVIRVFYKIQFERLKFKRTLHFSAKMI